MDDFELATKQLKKTQILHCYSECMNAWNKISNAYVDMLSNPSLNNAYKAKVLYEMMVQAADFLPNSEEVQTISAPRSSFRGQRM